MQPSLAWDWIDKTRYELLLQCERKAVWRHNRGFALIGVSSALANGLAWHDAMDVFWRLVSWCGVSPQDAVDPALDAWVRRWNESPAEGKKRTDLSALTTDTPPSREETATYNSKIVRQGLVEYANTFETRFEGYELLDIESSFDLEGPYGVRLKGRWDKPLLGPDGLIYVGEHKTTATMDKVTRGFPTNWEQKWYTDPGTKFYEIVGRKKFGSEFGGVLVDGVLLVPNAPALKSVVVTFGSKTLEMLYDDLALRLDRLKRGEAAFNWTECQSFGRMCEYADLCNAGWRIEEAPLPMRMEVNFWNPER